jgi:hypothetical protein
MNQPGGRQAFLRTIERDQRQLAEPNPLQKALDDYHAMERDRDQTQQHAAELIAANSALHAEVNMLREALERADADRIRLQAISSTLLGRLLAINDCIGGAVKASIKDGIEAVHAAKADDELERDAQEAQAIIQRVPPHEAAETPVARIPPPAPPQAAGGLPPGPFLR